MSAAGRALSELLRAADKAPADALGAVVLHALSEVGARSATLYVADYDQQWLQPAPGSPAGGRRRDAVPIEGTEAGRAWLEKRLIEGTDDHRLWIPVSERADCIGVLELELDRVDADVRALGADVGILLGHLLVSAHQYTDLYELMSRRRDMNLAAEMHWEIQPAMVYVGPQVALAGGIEPAYEVGGDAFDYNVNDAVVDFAILDAMGHGLEAALLSVQAVSAYRYARRRHQSLVEVSNTLEDAFVRQFGGHRFVTGLLCRLDARTGTFRWVNAAHLPPLLMRAGRVQEELASEVLCPLGLGLPARAEVNEIMLEPGDRIIVYSDGLIEARSPGGEDFELHRLSALIERADAIDAELTTTVRDVLDEVKAHCDGPLRDDASLVLLQFVAGSL